MNNEILQAIEQLPALISQLKMLVRGDEKTVVDLDGQATDSIRKMVITFKEAQHGTLAQAEAAVKTASQAAVGAAADAGRAERAALQVTGAVAEGLMSHWAGCPGWKPSMPAVSRPHLSPRP